MNNTMALLESPGEVGIPSEAILRLLERLERRRLVTHSLLVARHGRLAFEGYWAPYAATTPHRLYSASKSYVAIAVGALIDDGALRLDDLVADYFPEHLAADVVDDRITAMRVEDLLTMRTAHASTTYKQVDDPDWVRTFFTVPPTRTPGTAFSYDTSASVVLTALVERLSGKALPEYLMDRVLSRIGVEHPITALVSPTGTTAAERDGRPTAREVEINPLGVAHGGSGLFSTPHDFLRFAQLCLNNGRWGDDQVISSEYLRAATGYRASTAHVPGRAPDSRCGYGYQFWRTRFNGFSARGMGGQIALCLPDQELVVVTTGDNQGADGADQAFLDAVWEELLPRLDSADDPSAAAQLTDAAAALTLTPLDAERRLQPAHAATARWQLDAGPGAFTALELESDGVDGELRLIDRTGTIRSFPFGVGHLVRHELAGYGYETLSSGAWQDEQTFQLRSHVIGLYHAQLEMTVSVRGDAVVLMMNRAAEMFAQEYEGSHSGVRSS